MPVPAHRSHKYYEFMRSYFSGSSSYESRMALLDKVGSDSSTTPEAIVKAAFTAGDVQKLGALKELGRLGYSYCLTLADDRGSGKLHAWYEALGFVDLGFIIDPDETAMVAPV